MTCVSAAAATAGGEHSHEDEVNVCQFSNDGRICVSCSYYYVLCVTVAPNPWSSA
jgi:hypothetical protein